MDESNGSVGKRWIVFRHGIVANVRKPEMVENMAKSSAAENFATEDLAIFSTISDIQWQWLWLNSTPAVNSWRP